MGGEKEGIEVLSTPVNDGTLPDGPSAGFSAFRHCCTEVGMLCQDLSSKNDVVSCISWYTGHLFTFA